jgi:putative PIN family toxin of toxin-antitoxin system
VIVVLDTNIVVSSVLSPQGRSARILGYMRQNAFSAATSEEIVAEYAGALRYPAVARRHGLTDSELDEAVFPFALGLVDAPSVGPVCDDPGDDMFFACAAAAGADFIVSDDQKVLAVGTYQGCRVISSGAFLRLLEATTGHL